MKKFAPKPLTPHSLLRDFVATRTVLAVPLAAAAIAFALAARRPVGWLLAGAAAVLALSNLPFALWPRRMRPVAALWSTCLLDLAFVGLVVHATGGIGSGAVPLVFWPVVAAALLLGPRAALLVTLLAVLELGIVVLLQTGALTPSAFAPADLLAPWGLSIASGWGWLVAAAIALLVVCWTLVMLSSGLVASNARLQETLQTERSRLALQEETNRRLVVLEETGTILSRLQDLEVLLPRALQKLAGCVRAEAGFIVLYPPDVLEGVVAARLGLDENACRALLAGELPVQVEAIERSTWSKPSLGFQGHLAAPLRLGDEYLGTVFLLSRPGQQFQRGAKDLLHALGGQLAIAVRNVQFTQQLKAANEELLHVDRLKSDFLATMSHELRTPLTSVVGYTDMLLSGLAGEVSDKQKSLLRSVLNSSETLLNLINDILDLTKVEAGKMDLSLEPVDLRSVVGTAINLIGPKARERGIKVSSFIPGNLPPLLADPSRLEQIIVNLLSNAVKFTPELGSVTIEGRPLPTGFVEVRVSDTGIGIAPENLGRIFERFSQVDNTSTRSQGGTGLGLAITRDLIELHGGTITVQSQLGKGSVFIFTIPQALAARDAGAPERKGRGL